MLRMSGPPVIRQNNDITMVGDESQADGLPAPVVPWKWRRLTMRLGTFELGYASVRISPQNRLRHDRHYPVATRRGGFSSRFVEHLGFTTGALIFLGVVISVLAMRSGAFVTPANKWPIVDAGSGSMAPVAKAEMVKAAPAEKDKPTPVPTAVTLQPSIVRAAIRESIADLVRNGEMQGIDQTAGPGQAASGVDDRTRAAVMAGTLDRIPAVAAAIKRAMTTGEVQNWAAGGYEGVVVIGQGFQKDGAICREGSVLARDGGSSQTQPFERCSSGG